MSNQNDELERLMRLRDRQLSARDPGAKEREIQRKVAARRRRAKKQITFQEMLTDVSKKWQGIIIGAIVGMVISIVLTLTVEASWTGLAGLLAVLGLAILGFFFGQAFDVRDELNNL